MADSDIDLRRSAGFRLLQNPNYFGNLSDLGLPGIPDAVLKKLLDAGAKAEIK